MAESQSIPFAIDPAFKAQIPALSPQERAQLEANILREGCRDPLVVWQGLLVDGHNRYEICQIHGLIFSTIDLELPDRDAAEDWIDANQLGRRNLTPDQASLIRGRRYNRTKKRRGAPIGNTNRAIQSGQSVHIEPERTAETLATEHGVHERTIRRDGERAAFVDALPAGKKQAILDGEVKIAAVKRELRKAAIAKRVAEPNAKYRVIYADPPWSYNDKSDEGGVQGGGAEHHYPSMTIAELCALPVADWCESDAVLFLWVTSPLLYEAAPVIDAWGFTYKASFVWDKVKHNMGHYNSVRHEFLLVCTRGYGTPDAPQQIDSVQSIERTTHSRKPEEFRRIIDAIYPHGKRIELFARKAVEGWAAWGHEAPDVERAP